MAGDGAFGAMGAVSGIYVQHMYHTNPFEVPTDNLDLAASLAMPVGRAGLAVGALGWSGLIISVLLMLPVSNKDATQH